MKLITLTLAIASGLLASCAGLALEYTNDERVSAAVPVPTNLGKPMLYTVEASATYRFQNAVREMRNENYEKATKMLKQVVSRRPFDHRAHFALGVAYEVTGHYSSAAAEYAKASKKGREENFAYSESRDRALMKADTWAPVTEGWQ